MEPTTEQYNALAASIVRHLDAVPEETKEYRESLVYSLLSETMRTWFIAAFVAEQRGETRT